jgi:hypothetical protein
VDYSSDEGALNLEACLIVLLGALVVVTAVGMGIAAVFGPPGCIAAVVLVVAALLVRRLRVRFRREAEAKNAIVYAERQHVVGVDCDTTTRFAEDRSWSSAWHDAAKQTGTDEAVAVLVPNGGREKRSYVIRVMINGRPIGQLGPEETRHYRWVFDLADARGVLIAVRARLSADNEKKAFQLYLPTESTVADELRRCDVSPASATD